MYLRPQHLMWKRSTIKHVINVAVIIYRHKTNTANITTKRKHQKQTFLCSNYSNYKEGLEGEVKLLIMTAQWRYKCRWLHQRLKGRVATANVLKGMGFAKRNRFNLLAFAPLHKSYLRFSM
jgi:hypothetical protein